MAVVNLYVEEGPLQDFPFEGLPRQGSSVEEGSSTAPIEGHNCEILTSLKPKTGQQNQAWTYIPTRVVRRTTRLDAARRPELSAGAQQGENRVNFFFHSTDGLEP